MNVPFYQVANDFCEAQAKSVRYLEEASLKESHPCDAPCSYPKLPYDISVFIKKVDQFLFEVTRQKAAREADQMKVCGTLNRVVLSNEDIIGAVSRISRRVKEGTQESTLSHLEQVFAMVIESFGRGIFELARAAHSNKRGKEAVEKYEAGLAMVKFSQIVNPSKPKDEEIISNNPWDVPLNSACDVRITATKAGKDLSKKKENSFRNIKDPLAGLGRFQWIKEVPETQRMVSVNERGPETDFRRLEETVAAQHKIVSRFCEEHLLFSHWWYDFLGGHSFDYGYKRYIEKCQWQIQNSKTYIQSLSRLRHMLSKYIGRLQTCGPILSKAEHEEAMEILSILFLSATSDWYEQMAIGYSGASWVEIEREYGAAVIATERCLAQNEATYNLKL
ncbi:hypothetical protein FT663_03136 [Candidozyma haemuli var. vulneris]|uniref:Uncharacterized protein n=1 Tax=Candidozyma haemuli TaxID=45357 RepID=A0A2V1AX13_9ASCO|nr:hypothetical protein CXQ85_005191 [[Candida] haemuloni]KAF3985234.1 hypothetical protein FT662_05273 [[Candida] haemuloni var. vulneris]KAF3990577.1 hypothetical protein FT663_03136 [[Candida] haemuloni var. vulneris]PVH22617.1 hypothetical protein CXQ85_005191 [[Candida] haemuloni]